MVCEASLLSWLKDCNDQLCMYVVVLYRLEGQGISKSIIEKRINAFNIIFLVRKVVTEKSLSF